MSAADRAGLLQGILEDPSSELPFLAYADWCEENGDDRQAELVRRPFLELPAGHNAYRTRAYRDARAAVRGSLEGIIPISYHVYLELNDQLRDGKSLTEIFSDCYWGGSRKDFAVVVRHNFISEIGCSHPLFMKVAAALFARHPIRDVRLIGARPDDIFPGSPDDQFGYWRSWRRGGNVVGAYQGGEIVAAPVFDLLPGGRKQIDRHGELNRLYPSAAVAFRALSGACVAFARLAARLPGIPPYLPVWFAP